MKDYRKYLLPETIAKLKNIELKARLVVEGFITGLHRSPYHGFSVEFAEYRQYRPGDEVKNIDWRVFARSERYFIKQFEEETNMRSIIALDSSASMSYASKGNISKYEYASYLAAALALLMIKQRDATGLALYDTEIRKYLPPKSKPSYLNELLKTIDNHKPSEQTRTADALEKLAEQIKRRGMVVIMSDFFDDPESTIKALKHFRHKQHETIVFHILDPREIDFKFGDSATFRDIETGEELITQPYQIQKTYKKAMENFINNLRNECLKRQIDYHLVDTSQPFDKALREYFAKRRKL